MQTEALTELLILSFLRIILRRRLWLSLTFCTAPSYLRIEAYIRQQASLLYYYWISIHVPPYLCIRLDPDRARSWLSIHV